jgi:hypothetical protein
VLANRAGEHYLSPFYAVRICSREAKRKKSRKFSQWKTVFNLMTAMINIRRIAPRAKLNLIAHAT